MTFLSAFLEIFRVIKRYRERAAALRLEEADEREAERSHQRVMLETIFSKLVESQKVQSESIIALADAQRASAAVQQTWLDGFKIADSAPERPTVASPSQQWVREQLQLAEHGLSDIDLSNLAPEFQLAYELTMKDVKADIGDFDREGSDF